MSLHVAIIPEDATYDASILKPVITAMLKLIGKPNAKIEVVNGNPKIQGKSVQQAQLDKICDKYKSSIIIIARDNDCVKENKVEKSLDEYCRIKQPAGIQITCVVAQQEIEAWLLVNQITKLNSSIQNIRNNCVQVSLPNNINKSILKDTVFRPFINQHGNSRMPDEGREKLMTENLNINDLMNKCEELGGLREKLAALLPA